MTPDILCIGSILWDIIGRSPTSMRLGSDVPGRITRLPGGDLRRDPAALRVAVAGFPAVDWAEAAPTLEDVFIDLMRTAPDNSVVAW